MTAKQSRAGNALVFLSHSSSDKWFVRMLAQDLTLAPCSVWLDERELRPGDALPESLRWAVHNASHLVVCLSQAAIESPWVQRELDLAYASGRRRSPKVIPALLGPVDPEQLPSRLTGLIHVDFRQPSQYDREFRRLVSALGDGCDASAVLAIDAFRRDRLVASSDDCQLRTWIVDYLGSTVAARPDATERYWTYVILGQIGGADVALLVEQGLRDPDPFARRGAADAQAALLSLPRSRPHSPADPPHPRCR